MPTKYRTLKYGEIIKPGDIMKFDGETREHAIRDKYILMCSGSLSLKTDIFRVLRKVKHVSQR